MFDFLDSDEFVIGLEIVFLIFIAYDAWKYSKTRKKEYLVNIVLAIGFAAWVLYPFYVKYYEWEGKSRESAMQKCVKEHNTSYCSCVEDLIFKTYDEKSFSAIDKKNDAEYLEFIKESEAECFED